MKAKFYSDTGRAMMRIRRTTVEPLFGQTKHCRCVPLIGFL